MSLFYLEMRFAPQFLFAVGFLLLVPVSANQFSGFLVEPKAVTTTLRSGNFAVFDCIVTRDGEPFWAINGTNAGHYKSNGVVPTINLNWESEGLSGIPIRLEVPTTVLFNSSLVTCRAFFGDVWKESIAALLLLQGLLDAPTITELACHSLTTTLMWSAPFTLQSSDNPIYEYLVITYIFFNSLNIESSVNTVNSKETHFTAFLNQSFTEYCFVVSAVNSVGEGKMTTPACIHLSNCTGYQASPSHAEELLRPYTFSQGYPTQSTILFMPSSTLKETTILLAITPISRATLSNSRPQSSNITIIIIVVVLEAGFIILILVVLGIIIAAYKRRGSSFSGNDLSMQMNEAYGGARVITQQSTDENENADKEEIYSSIK